MLLASATIDTIRDLGVPGVLGTIAGALIAHLAAKARSREEHKRTLELLVLQDERRAAQAALDASRELMSLVPASDAPPGSAGYENLYRQWKDRVERSADLIRSEELVGRKSATGLLLFFAANAKEGDYVHDAVCVGLRDVETWLSHWLRNEEPPPPALPSTQKMTELTDPSGRLSFARLQERLPPLQW